MLQRDPEERNVRFLRDSARPRKRIISPRIRIIFIGSSKPGVLRKKNPGFCAARAANERLFERSPRFGRKKTGDFLMARARIIFFRNAKQNRESLLWAPGGPPFFLFFLNRKTPSLNRSGGVTGLHMHIHADY